MSSHDFPADLYSDLLSRLPTKTLLKFKSVSKLWLSIIKDPNFSSMHANRLSDSSSTTQVCLLRSFDNDVNQLVNKICEISGKVFRPLPDEILNKMTLRLVGSSNGVLCLAYRDETSKMHTVLWNPFSKQYHVLPPLPPHYWSFDYTYGFGYDNVNNDYKVLCFDSSSWTITTRAMIYSRKLNTWRSISLDKFPNSKLVVHLSGLLYGGSLYFISIIDYSLVAFDLTNEEFKNISKSSPEYWEFVIKKRKSNKIGYYDLEEQSDSRLCMEALNRNDCCSGGGIFPYIQTLELY